MPGKSEKLSFFCEKCGQAIERNICPSHGIDFVTIKKISLNKQPKDRQVREAENAPTAGGLARLNASQSSESSGNSGMGIARLDDIEDRPAENGSALLPLDAVRNDQADHEAEEVFDYTGAPEDSVADNTFTRQNPYRDTEPDVEEYYHPDDQHRHQFEDEPVAVQQPKVLLWAILGTILIAIAGFSYYFYAGAGTTPTALYSSAEAAMEGKQFDQAREMYSTFLRDFPEDPLMPVVREKLAIVERKILNERAGTPEGQRRIQQLMLKANIAFNSGNFVTPVDDNAANHLMKILRISPNYQPALDMQQKIFDQFQEKATAEEEAGNLNEALSYYQVMSSLKPNNMDVLAKIQALLSSAQN